MKVSKNLFTAILLLSECHAWCEDPARDLDFIYLNELVATVVWKDGMPDWSETKLEVDLKRVHVLAQDTTRSRIQGLAWLVLGAVKEPSQLEFLINIALKQENRKFLGGPAGLPRCIAMQVRTAEDEKKLSPLLAEEKLFPLFIWALRNTADSSLLSKVLDSKFGKEAETTSLVNEFIAYRINRSLPLDPLLCEPFLKQSCLSRKPRESSAYQSAQIAAQLKFKWAVHWLAAMLAECQKHHPVPMDSKASAERDRLYDSNQCIFLIQKLTGENFECSKEWSFEEVESSIEKVRSAVDPAIQKCLAWWKENSERLEYRLKP